jgi:hypothetical protein
MYIVLPNVGWHMTGCKHVGLYLRGFSVNGRKCPVKNENKKGPYGPCYNNPGGEENGGS